MHFLRLRVCPAAAPVTPARAPTCQGLPSPLRLPPVPVPGGHAVIVPLSPGPGGREGAAPGWGPSPPPPSPAPLPRSSPVSRLSWFPVSGVSRSLLFSFAQSALFSPPPFPPRPAHLAGWGRGIARSGGKPGLLFTFCVTKNLGELQSSPAWVTAGAAAPPPPPGPAAEPAPPPPQQQGWLGTGRGLRGL